MKHTLTLNIVEIERIAKINTSCRLDNGQVILLPTQLLIELGHIPDPKGAPITVAGLTAVVNELQKELNKLKAAKAKKAAKAAGVELPEGDIIPEGEDEADEVYDGLATYVPPECKKEPEVVSLTKQIFDEFTPDLPPIEPPIERPVFIMQTYQVKAFDVDGKPISKEIRIPVNT